MPLERQDSPEDPLGSSLRPPDRDTTVLVRVGRASEGTAAQVAAKGHMRMADAVGRPSDSDERFGKCILETGPMVAATPPAAVDPPVLSPGRDLC